MKHIFIIVTICIGFLCITFFLLSFLLSKENSVAKQKLFNENPSAEKVQMIIKDLWVSSENLQITIYSADGLMKTVTKDQRDYKPSWSKDGTMIVFFRLYSYGSIFNAWNFKKWRTKICVINADGTGFRELTSGKYPDFNPTWTRDGSNRILFNRYYGGWHNQVYWILPTDSPGDEQLISDPAYPDCEWVTGALKDGRIFIDRMSDTVAQSFLLTPNPYKRGKYEEIKRPTNLLWHKLNISPSETKITYMLDYDRNLGTFKDSAICYANFNVNTLEVTNQVHITKRDLSFISEYPCWNGDETLILYDANKSGKYQIYAYRLLDGVTARISSNSDHNYQFVSFKGLPK